MAVEQVCYWSEKDGFRWGYDRQHKLIRKERIMSLLPRRPIHIDTIEDEEETDAET